MAEHECGDGTERNAKAFWAIPERRYLILGYTRAKISGFVKCEEGGSGGGE
jgi:hypothetical protein